MIVFHMLHTLTIGDKVIFTDSDIEELLDLEGKEKLLRREIRKLTIMEIHMDEIMPSHPICFDTKEDILIDASTYPDRLMCVEVSNNHRDKVPDDCLEKFKELVNTNDQLLEYCLLMIGIARAEDLDSFLKSRKK